MRGEREMANLRGMMPMSLEGREVEDCEVTDQAGEQMHVGDADEHMHVDEANDQVHGEANGQMHVGEADEHMHVGEANGQLHVGEANGQLHVGRRMDNCMLVRQANTGSSLEFQSGRSTLAWY